MRILKNVRVRTRIPMSKIRVFMLENRVVQTQEVQEFHDRYSDGKDGLWVTTELLYEMAYLYCRNSYETEETTEETLEGTMHALSLMVEQYLDIGWYDKDVEKMIPVVESGVEDVYFGALRQNRAGKAILMRGTEQLLSVDLGMEPAGAFLEEKVKEYYTDGENWTLII